MNKRPPKRSITVLLVDADNVHTEYELKKGATIKRIMQYTNRSFTDHVPWINGERVKPTKVLQDMDVVVFTERVKGPNRGEEKEETVNCVTELIPQLKCVIEREVEKEVKRQLKKYRK